MNDIYVRLVSFPVFSVRSAVILDENGDYNIYLDERLSDEDKRRALHHEYRHIKNNHFRDAIAAHDAEKEAEK